MNLSDKNMERVQEVILNPAELSLETLPSLFSRIGSRKIDYSDLYFQYSRSESWSIEDGIVKVGSFNIDQGVGARAIVDEKTASPIRTKSPWQPFTRHLMRRERLLVKGLLCRCRLRWLRQLHFTQTKIQY